MPKRMSLNLRNALSKAMKRHVTKVRKTGSRKMSKSTKKTLKAVMIRYNGG